MTYLDSILEQHRERAKTDTRRFDQLVEQAHETEPTRGFIEALSMNPDGLAVISEIKRGSPSKGTFQLSPAITGIDSWAKSYKDGGATCLSVLTDSEFFGGSVEDLQLARAAVDLPVLRKDFTVSVNDIVDSKIMGADAVLLIAAALEQKELKDFYELATELELDCLIEVHDEKEAERALSIEAKLIGVNQRDLETFEVDTNRATRVGKMLPTGTFKVAESGITDAADALPLRECGFDAILVGESLATSEDPSKAVSALRKV